MDAGIYFPPSIPLHSPISVLSDRTPGTRDHDGRFHTIGKFDGLYFFCGVGWLFGCHSGREEKVGKMRKWKTYVTDGIGPTAYRPSLVSCTFTCFHIPIFFTSVRFCAAGIVLSGEKGQWEEKKD